VGSVQCERKCSHGKDANNSCGWCGVPRRRRCDARPDSVLRKRRRAFVHGERGNGHCWFGHERQCCISKRLVARRHLPERQTSVVEIAVTATVRSGRFGERQQQISATGTGIVIDGSGHILTNYHVIAGAQTVEVQFDDGATVSAVIGGTDPANDVAVIKVDPSAHSLAPATLGDASTVRVGDSVLALGNPFELDGTLTKGIVSGLNRTFAEDSNTTLSGLIQTDAAVNPGNSGGPLLDSQGQVIGINTLLDNPTGETVFVGVAFAVSINTVKTELASLIP
jgi:S1-C subfamily serine protease